MNHSAPTAKTNPNAGTVFHNSKPCPERSRMDLTQNSKLKISPSLIHQSPRCNFRATFSNVWQHLVTYFASFLQFFRKFCRFLLFVAHFQPKNADSTPHYLAHLNIPVNLGNLCRLRPAQSRLTNSPAQLPHFRYFQPASHSPIPLFAVFFLFFQGIP